MSRTLSTAWLATAHASTPTAGYRLVDEQAQHPPALLPNELHLERLEPFGGNQGLAYAPHPGLDVLSLISLR